MTGADGVFSIYETCMLFFIYAFLGWVTEVCFHALKNGQLVNRGFLNGPICPIYGFGVLFVLQELIPVAGHALLVFVVGAIVCTLLELVTGFALEKIFHQRWWDYSEEPFNIGGYVCLRFSFIWGLACVFVVRVIHPVVETLVDKIPHLFGTIFLIVGLLLLAIDVIATVTTIHKSNRNLKIIHETAQNLRKVTDELTENIYKKSIRVKEGVEELGHHLDLDKKIEALEEKKAQLDEKKDGILKKKIRGQRRMFKAFPHMASTYYQEALEEKKKLVEMLYGDSIRKKT